MDMKLFLSAAVLLDLCLLIRACGYSTCPAWSTDPNTLNVHLIAHSHDDVGYRKTVDEYYYGTKPDEVYAGVQYIIDTVVKELRKDPQRKYIQVETGFFKRWWDQQSPAKKSQVQQLVDEGRLEMVGGGWSMHDEADSHYSAIVDNMSYGLRTLNESLGPCAAPRVGWQIDPFGHSRENAALFAKLGFDALFFARIDQRDKDQRKRDKTLQFIWEGSDSLGETTSLFTGVFAEHYDEPAGFCFDGRRCSDDPIQDDPTLSDYNLDTKLDLFMQYLDVERTYFMDSNHVMVMMGRDFTFQSAHFNFKSIDKLIRGLNGLPNGNVTAFYSTPSCFAKALNDANIAWPTVDADFMPYSRQTHEYWSGFYTSKPALKRHEQRNNAALQSAKQIDAFINEIPDKVLNDAREAQALVQHHDAITGTSTQFVNDDYDSRLWETSDILQRRVAEELFAEAGIDLSQSAEERFHCPGLNISQCFLTESNEKLLLLIYNPLSRSDDPIVRIPYDSRSGDRQLRVYDQQGAAVSPVQFMPISERVAGIPGRSGNSDMEVFFKADSIPALGFKVYYLEHIDSVVPTNLETQLTPTEFQNQLPLGISMKYYRAFQSLVQQNSGNYIFRPLDVRPNDTEVIGAVTRIDGPVLTEWRVENSLDVDWMGFNVRQYDHASRAYEVDYIVGPIDVDDGQGKEVIMAYSSGLVANNGLFKTDSNGRQLIQRIRNERATFNLSSADASEEPVASNYYPITSTITIEDDEDILAALPDRSSGGSSINDGEIELMLHRRLLFDDGIGVEEPLNEISYGVGLVIRGTHWVSLANEKDDVIRWKRRSMLRRYLQTEMFFAPTALSLSEWISDYPVKSKSALTSDLSDNVNLLTLEKAAIESGEDGILLRLEHIFEAGEHSTLSQVASVDLENLFVDFAPNSITEMTLGGNLPLDSLQRLQWTSAKSSGIVREPLQGTAVDLQPMEIRTFLLK